jgi:hypothetical protein
MNEMSTTGMKERTIKLMLGRKIQDWLKHIDDPQLSYRIGRDVIVTGGAITSMLLGEKVNDYDLYFKTRETALEVAHYYAKKMNETMGDNKCIVVREEKKKNIKGDEEDRILMYIRSAGVAKDEENEDVLQDLLDETPEEITMEELIIEPLEAVHELAKKISPKKPRYRPVFISENAITLSDDIQLVVRFYGNTQEIHNNYDFVHCMNVYDYSQNKLTLLPEALQSTLAKDLIYKGSLYPMASLFRLRKFIARGWRVTAGQMLKIVFQLNEVNLKDMDILREQLVGVDMSYMLNLINMLKKAQKEDIDIDSAYLCKVIEEVFE